MKIFGKENKADFATGSMALQLFADVEELILQLDGAKAGQEPGRMNREDAYKELKLDFKNFNKTVRTTRIKDKSFVATPFLTPRSMSMSKALTHADAMLEWLEDVTEDSADGKIKADTPAQLTAKAALRAKFIAREMAGDFVEDLRADRDGLVAAGEHNAGDAQEIGEYTARIETLLKETAGTVVKLDAIMGNKYSRQPEKQRKWEMANRVERAPVRAKKVETTSAATGNPA